MKKCHKCRKRKPLEDFPVNRTRKDGRSETCLVCKRRYNRLHYQNNKKYYVDKAQRSKDRVREIFWAYKSDLKCVNCGESHPAALHFHHDDPKEKDIEIATAITRGWSMTRIMDEINKCKVMCASCHAILHWEQRHGEWTPCGCDRCTPPSEGGRTGAIPVWGTDTFKCPSCRCHAGCCCCKPGFCGCKENRVEIDESVVF